MPEQRKEEESEKLRGKRDQIQFIDLAYSILSVAETRDRTLEFLSRKVDFMRRFPVAFLTNGVSIVTRGEIELTTLVS